MRSAAFAGGKFFHPPRKKYARQQPTSNALTAKTGHSADGMVPVHPSSRRLTLSRPSTIERVDFMETATMHLEETANIEFSTTATQMPSERAVCSNAIIAGSLFGDLGAVARELCRVVQHYPVTAWMNADADVLYQPARGDVPAIHDWIAGTYAFGATVADIEDDLNQLRAQRRTMGMIEV
jgi:hypothetical protein